MGDYSILQLPDGTQLAYEVLGSDHRALVPLVFVSGTTSCRGDTEKVSSLLAKHRQVLVYDHRGMGDSKARKDDPFTMETLARDLLSLIQHLHWSEVALCGHSMGGAIVQGLLFLPFHRTNPTPLRFRVTHVVLAGARFTPNLDPRYGLKFPMPPKGPLTRESIREAVRLAMLPNYDPEWFASGANQERIEQIIDRSFIGRPFKTILQQKRAGSQYDFTGFHSRLSPDTQFMIIHGELDQIVPFSNVQTFLRFIPWARVVPVGDAPGSVPTLRFGHDWIELDVGRRLGCDSNSIPLQCIVIYVKWYKSCARSRPTALRIPWLPKACARMCLSVRCPSVQHMWYPDKKALATPP